MKRFRIVALATALLSLTASTSARATDDDPRKVQAEPPLREGQKLYAQGRYDDALVKLKDAYAIYASPNVLSLIALVEQALGRSLDALGHFREALRNPTLHPENAELARKAIGQLERKVGRVDIRGPRGLVVSVGKNELALPLKEPIDVEAGTVHVDGKLAETSYRGQALAAAGTVVVIDMKPESATSLPIEPPAAGGGDQTRWGTGQYLGLGLIGAGVVALAAGGGFAIAKGNSSDKVALLERSVGPNDNLCVGRAPPQACEDVKNERNTRDRDGTASMAFFIGGAVAAVAGAMMIVLWPKPQASRTGVTVIPLVGPGSAGMQLHF